MAHLSLLVGDCVHQKYLLKPCIIYVRCVLVVIIMESGCATKSHNYSQWVILNMYPTLTTRKIVPILPTVLLKLSKIGNISSSWTDSKLGILKFYPSKLSYDVLIWRCTLIILGVLSYLLSWLMICIDRCSTFNCTYENSQFTA